uniref:Receptor-like serine/threonine-protein kinase n=1 Tax=Tanacetum cinerariifolium TaxID=118510 RepID=A0A6L2LUH1_TANCI|nr:G-type lectin S-receptor-like serine/threonine-protein kinase At4g27290 [Tanacetum cinerariifolium]
MGGATIVVVLMSLLHFHKVYAAELNAISDSQLLTDGDTLVSESGIFELGFFRPAGSSENKYLGIRYKNISVTTLVWVANKDHALPSASSNVLKITNPGILIVFSNMSMIWSSNTTMTTSQNVTAKLHDTGNLVLLDQHETVIWQSFDYPTDTLLPGMKLGKDYSRGIEWKLSSWKSIQDPAPGEFTWGPEESGYPESKLKQGSLVKFRGGVWRNRRVSAVNFTSVYNIVITPKEKSFSYNDGNNSSVLGRVTLNSSGALEAWALVEGKRWHLMLRLPIDTCDTYNICSYYGSCSVNLLQQSCTCLDVKRFMPRNQKAWEMADWSGGCVRRRPLECKNGSDGFIKYSDAKLPDTENTWFDMNMTLDECEIKCLNNCTCMAYANPDMFKERVCVLWFEELKDIRVYSESNVAGSDIYVRMASSELDNTETTIARPTYKKKRRVNLKMILLLIIPRVVLISLISTWLWFAHKRRNHVRQMEGGGLSRASKNQDEAFELLVFRFSIIATATSSFSSNNILGSGGFGPVYKGVLEEGLEIAVKRLSKSSSQGVDEFMNEVICISKLQHRNLVKLLGCCIKGDEKLLIYEYMPNGSLDSFIFDTTQGMFLNWAKRFDIINGISRGLVYLHQDSRLRIIHRDLKASNILLDLNMNPKISDFGIARSFGGNESQANTERVVGTYGYMSPEYALRGVFSIKSDVFSFGVLVLEIVSGKKNWGFSQAESENNLIGYAWNIYNEGRFMELIDADLAESCNPPEVLRSIQVGLLCVQHNAGDRPNMPCVIQMLSGEGALPQPKQPAFFMENQLRVADFPPSTCLEGSVSGLTITEVDAR